MENLLGSSLAHLHYFRIPNYYWQDRMSKLKSLGVNTIETLAHVFYFSYIEWSQHEPEVGQYDFEGNLDVVKFFQTAQKMGLLVILRPGPYIDAERDFGGLPYWLLKNKNLKVRSSDPSYMVPVSNWMGILLPKLKPLTYENGGPIISAQVENEYGSYFIHDKNYTETLRDILRQHLGKNTLLFSTDGDSVGDLKHGTVPEVYATVDFGSGTNVQGAFKTQRVYSPKGPLVNSEFYSGWLDHWAHPHAKVSGVSVSKTLDQILAINASVSIYMGHGGTSFGFTAGKSEPMEVATHIKRVQQVTITDAPISEAGDITPKFMMMRKVIQKAHGYVLYRTTVNTQQTDPTLLKVSGIRDRGYVFVDDRMVSRGEQILQLPLTIEAGQNLAIIVENQGRICFGSGLQDPKGIFPPVYLGNKELFNWTMTKMPLEKNGWLSKTLKTLEGSETCGEQISTKVPAFYVSHFKLPRNQPNDTFLRMDGWFKGVAILNDFNLGRYWPVVGPQVTLYTPKILFKPYPNVNTLIMMEFENAPCETAEKCFINFVKVPEINGPTPN
ncbi:Beta-galactosidase [Nymphon striatum]|nr:Beta-galactosidase [Nymphon striatum]